MKSLIGTGALAVALLLTGCGGEDGNKNGSSGGAPVAAVPPPQGGDWTQVVSKTPQGGFRMGNPNAPVKLVEYASVTCPHCAEFEEQGVPTLVNDYVKTGRVSWEFRHFMLFPTDPAISSLVRCQGPEPFFALTEQLYADQRNWVGKVQALPQSELQRLQTLPPQQQAAELVRTAGIDQFFRQRGIPQAKIDACLADPQGLQELVALQNLATTEGVHGTPTFFINGAIVEDAATWATLQPALRKAVGQ
jgi:protein-disulfide isomerase